MKYILRGNDIPVTWNLKDYSTWEPISVPQSASSFYVYSNDLRVKIDDFTITDSVLTSTIAGNLLPSGKYTLELIWNNNGWGRTIAIGVFSVTDGGENADRIDTDSTISLWELLAAATSEQINISHLKDALKNYSTGSGGTSSGDSDILDIVLRKDKDDLTPHNLTIGKLLKASNLEATSSAKTPYLTVSVLAKIAKIFVDIIGTEKFVDGFLGEGWQIWKAIASGDWNFTIDRMTIRKTLTVFEMIIQKIRAVGGALIVSAADGKIKTVEESGDNYAITFEDDNMFIEHDLARMQVYSGAGNVNVIRYYWVEVGHVDGSTIYVPKSEFEGVAPLVGDEWVLMGNTTNTLRQNLIYISATEDGQPRIDVLENVKTKNLEGCMTVRLGNLDGITDNSFPTDVQPSGNGLYGNNVFLRGRFVLSNNGKDISTLFEILEGKITANLKATRIETNENILYNSSFVENTDFWACNNDVRIMTYGGKFFMPNGVLYSFKNKIAETYEVDHLNVIKILGSSISQINSKFQNLPEFNSVKEISKDESGIIITDEDGKPVEVDKKYAKNFTLSFYYKCDTAGTLHVEMTDCVQGVFEPFSILNQDIQIDVNNGFVKKSIQFEWNGTGNFLLSFTGLIYIYNLQINWNDAMDLKTEMESNFEYTAEHFQMTFTKIKETATNVETYKSSFELSAEQMKAEYTKMVGDLQTDYSAFKVSAEQTLSVHAQNITDAQNAADQAANAADQAAEKATDAYNKSTTNATAILQTQDYISLISASFNSDGSINTTGLVTIDGNFSSLFTHYMGENNIVVSADLDVYVKKDATGKIISGIKLSADQLDFNADNIRINASHIEFIGQTFFGTHISFDSLGNLTFEQGAKATWYNTYQATETDNYVQIQGSNASGLIYSKSTYSNYTAAYFVNTNSNGTALKAAGNVVLGIGVDYSRVKMQGLNMPTLGLTSSGPSYTGSKVWMCNVDNASSFSLSGFPSPQDGDILIIRKCASGNLTITGNIYNGWDGSTGSVTLTQGSLGFFIYSTHIGVSNHSGWTSNFMAMF